MRGPLSKRFFPRMGFDAGASSAFASLAFYGLLAAAFLFALRAVNIPLTAFAVAGGTLAIGIGFGSQTIISNFISGLLLLAERPIRTGDLVARSPASREPSIRSGYAAPESRRPTIFTSSCRSSCRTRRSSRATSSSGRGGVGIRSRGGAKRRLEGLIGIGPAACAEDDGMEWSSVTSKRRTEVTPAIGNLSPATFEEMGQVKEACAA